MSYRLPPKGGWTQPNRGDLQGSLWSTFNVDLTRKKDVIRGTRMVTTTSTSSDLTNLGLPVAFAYTYIGSTRIYCIGGSRVFYASVSQPSAFTEDVSAPTTCSSDTSDMTVFNTSLYVSTNSRVVYKLSSAGNWSNFNYGGVDTGPVHMFCVYAGRLYRTIGNTQVISSDTSDTVATSGTNTLQLATATTGGTLENIITFIRASSTGIWVGTVNALGGNGHVYFWNGVTADTVTNIYTLESTGAMAGFIKDDVLYIMDNFGRLMHFNGGTFVELARLPLFTKKMLNGGLNQSNSRWIHPNGIIVVNGKINISVNLEEFSNSSQNEENCPSGIWEYDKDIGLYHKFSVSYYDSITASLTDYGQQRLVPSSVAGTTGGSGAIIALQNFSDAASQNGTLLAGFNYYTDATSSKFGIFYDDNLQTVQTYSYIITPKIPATGLQDVWNRLYIIHKPFLTGTDKFIVKYRITDVAPTEGTITWVSTTGFTTSLNLSSYAVGDEVEILQGIGGGLCSHITQMQVVNGGGYMVTVDETYTGATGTAVARFQKWRKVGNIQDVSDMGELNLTGINRSYFQLKICMLSTGKNEMQWIGLVNAINRKLE